MMCKYCKIRSAVTNADQKDMEIHAYLDQIAHVEYNDED
tara:strand:+ start:7198 stop:7314 length:117 start_codon:yes stop_codon:yes gene_type:complete